MSRMQGDVIEARFADACRQLTWCAQSFDTDVNSKAADFFLMLSVYMSDGCYILTCLSVCLPQLPMCELIRSYVHAFSTFRESIAAPSEVSKA
jgi:hypothetical protein